MWISAKYSPEKAGMYTCLVQHDEFGCMLEEHNQEFDGTDWDWHKSYAQFINYWLCDDYRSFLIKVSNEAEISN